MAIQMIGIDHSVAAIDIRTIFSFTQKKTVEALEIIKQEKGICGCVLLSTCNRMELWVSTEEGCVIALYELLCKIRAIHNDEYQKYFEKDKIFNASTCGDNCAKWLLKIAESEDRTINLRHLMNFGKDPFVIRILNTGEIVHSMEELVSIAGEFV